MFESVKYGDLQVHTVYIVKWISEFLEVTEKRLGLASLLKGIWADIKMKPGAQSQFCMSRTISLALKEQVEQLIWQQVKDGKLEPVQSSDWVVPTVIVKKIVASDFKMAVNPQLHPKACPLPTFDESRASPSLPWIFPKHISK